MKQRSAKKVQKWKERFERERQLRQEIRAVAPDILRSKNFAPHVHMYSTVT